MAGSPAAEKAGGSGRLTSWNPFSRTEWGGHTVAVQAHRLPDMRFGPLLICSPPTNSCHVLFLLMLLLLIQSKGVVLCVVLTMLLVTLVTQVGTT